MTRLGGGRALITGGAGFVGTNLAARLLEQGERVVLLDNLSRPGVERNLAWLLDCYGPRVTFEQADIRDRFAVRRALAGTTSVFHLAAQVAVTTSLDEPLNDFEVNAHGTVTLLEELRRMSEPPFFLFTSTNKVYGALPWLELVRRERRWEPVDDLLRTRGLSERLPLRFCTPYGCSKGAADQYVLDFAASYSVPSVVFRMSCIYGPHQHGTEDQGWVAHFALRVLEQRPITLYGDGAQVRDILFVDDLVEAMLAARERRDSVRGTAFNVGGGPANAVSLLEVLDVIGRHTGSLPPVQREAERPGDQRYYVTDTREIAAALGWQPRVTAVEGIERLVTWLTDSRTPAVPMRAAAQ
jgi:CDP-paratose 2-epimerase